MSSGQPFAIGATPAPGTPFHLAVPVHSMKEAREFYGGVLQLEEGRRDGEKWQDYSLFGHQLVCHYVGSEYRCPDFYNPVDGDEVPVPHFGAALPTEEVFHAMAERIRQAGLDFIIEPTLRFKGAPGEQVIIHRSIVYTDICCLSCPLCLSRLFRPRTEYRQPSCHPAILRSNKFHLYNLLVDIFPQRSKWKQP